MPQGVVCNSRSGFRTDLVRAKHLGYDIRRSDLIWNISRLCKMSVLKPFTVLLDKFLTELTLVFPEEKSLRVYHVYATQAVAMNPRLVVECFKEYILPYKDSIQSRDETFFLARDYTKEIEEFGSSVNVNMMDAIRMKELWKVMSDGTKTAVWEYMNKLVELAQRA